jgi:putative FmdB family regulatory protein
MPTYEYECERTGRRFEVRQAMADRPLEECPECGGRARRIIGTGAGVIIRGGGSRRAPSCGRESPCCGRATPCDTSPCE